MCAINVLPPMKRWRRQITDILGAEPGQQVSIKNGGTNENGVKILKSDKFSLIKSDWTPNRNDVITLMKVADDKFIEISRESGVTADALAIPADTTEIDLAGGTEFVVGKNTQATAVTALKNAEPGVVYTIYGNGDNDANATTIAKGGKFLLSKDITLCAGVFLKVVVDADGNIHEVSRG